MDQLPEAVTDETQNNGLAIELRLLETADCQLQEMKVVHELRKLVLSVFAVIRADPTPSIFQPF